MNYAIMRHSKITSNTQLASVHLHNTRSINVPNSTRPNAVKRLVGGSEKLSTLVNDKIHAAGAKVRKNSVLAVEVLLTASPDYFAPKKDAKQCFEWDDKSLHDWYEATRKFLVKKYGSNLAAVDLHLDEKTPHIHAVVVPLAKKKRKLRGKDEYITEYRLDAKNTFSPLELSKSQTEYANAVEHLGLNRGMEGSTKKHKALKELITPAEVSKLVHKLDQYREANKILRQQNAELISQIQKMSRPKPQAQYENDLTPPSC